MSPSELKYQVEQAGHEPHFFARSTMKFFGDTMRNYGVRQATINKAGQAIECWELYRKQAVKHGLNTSAYFNKKTLERVRDTSY